MSDFFMIDREDMPCLYELSFDCAGPAIIVKAHKEFLSRLPKLDSSPKINSLREEFGFSEFQQGFEGKNFGFNGVFSREKDDDEFAVFRVSIPRVKGVAEKKCPVCNGEKKGIFGECLRCEGRGKFPEMCSDCNGAKIDDEGGQCLMCDGEGVKTYYDWNSAFTISASFSVLFDLAFLACEKSSAVFCGFPQLILINTAVARESNPLDGVYSIPLVDWLKSFKPSTEIAEMKRAMALTWEHLFGKFSSFDAADTWARANYGNGLLAVSCPGDRCCLYHTDSNNFSCHNVDTSAQQITLLAGLAALCDRVKKEIKNF